mgnify:CR=1 FL=1|tara:strand:+ start:155 stop:412 length:258 start_codon:yes stop_codon:yes gene_type:complete
MRNHLDSDVRHALEVIGTASTGVRLEMACLLLRQSIVDPAIGVVGRGFLKETVSGLQAAIDWIEVGDREATQATQQPTNKREFAL